MYGGMATQDNLLCLFLLPSIKRHRHCEWNAVERSNLFSCRRMFLIVCGTLTDCFVPRNDEVGFKKYGDEITDCFASLRYARNDDVGL